MARAFEVTIDSLVSSRDHSILVAAENMSATRDAREPYRLVYHFAQPSARACASKSRAMGPQFIDLRRSARLLFVACLGAVSLTCAMPAGAQEIETARMTARIDKPIIVTNTADMDFGKIAYSPTAGTVLMRAAATTTCTTTGTLVRIGTCRAAKFEGSVSFLFNLQVTQPAGNSIILSGPSGATMRLDNFTYGAGPGMLDLGQSGTNHRFWILNLNGSYSFYMGGTLHVGANQAPGVYNGTFQIQLNYN